MLIRADPSLERVRSLSPSKTGPTPSTKPVGDTTPLRSRGIEPPVTLTPPLRPQTLGRSGSITSGTERTSVASLDFTRPLPPQTIETQPSVPSPPPSATSLSRSGTLSWNQRPLSRNTGIGSVRSRPQSVASIPDALSLRSPSPTKDVPELSRKEIAASLGARDPSWFRQTSDRGLNSAAYRKNESDLEGTTSTTTRSMRLPGMATEKTHFSDRSSETFQKSSSPSSPQTVPQEPSPQSRQASLPERAAHTRPVSMFSVSPSKSPALDPPSLKSPDSMGHSDVDGYGLARTSSILSSAGRPPSPTKGLGGFVQSAMMKRSDSVSKRWSVQAGTGLKRGDSVATSRPAHLSNMTGFNPGHSRGSSRDIRPARDGESSPLSTSRPVSSHGTEPVPLSKSHSTPRSDDSAIVAKPNLLSEDDTQDPITSHVQQTDRPHTPPPSETLLSRSPSKTLDTRRWSPTKASWLESALNKPDTPKFIPAKLETPAWKLDMQRSKEQQERLSATGSGSKIKSLDAAPSDSSTSERPSSISKAQSNAVPIPSQKPPELQASVQSKDSQPVTIEDHADIKKDVKPLVPSKRNITPAKVAAEGYEINLNQPTSIKKDAVTVFDQAKIDTKSPISKPKPQTPPKTDFRAGLKSRQATTSENNGAEPEFKAVFGKLKRTQTQNYVAPDVLKDNITRGKAALSVTGGPQPSKRVDEFKESILQKKEAMKAAAGAATKRPEPIDTLKDGKPQLPEALAKRNALQKTGSSQDTDVKATSGASASLAMPLATKLNRASTTQVEPTPPKTAAWKDVSLGVSKVPNVSPKPLLKEKSLSEPSPRMTVEKKPAINIREGGLTEQSSSLTKDTESQEHIPRSQTPILSEKSKLAARLNPALAGMLSRSGSPQLPGDRTSQPGQLSSQTSASGKSMVSESTPAELTHMTKARAKGPKRRAPKDKPAPQATRSVSTSSKPEPTIESSKPAPLAISSAKAVESPSLKPVTLKPTPRKPSANIEISKVAVDSKLVSPANKPEPIKSPADEILVTKKDQVVTQALPTDSSSKPKPLVAEKSDVLRKVSSPDLQDGKQTGPPAKPATPKKFSVLSDRISLAPSSEKAEKPSVTGPTNTISMPLTPSRSKLNTPKPKIDSDSSPKPPLSSTETFGGLGLRLDSSSKKPVSTPELTPPPEPDTISLRAKPLPSKPLPSKPLPSKPASLKRPASGAKAHLETLFGVLPYPTDQAEFDTHSFLSSKTAPPEKSKTLSHQIWEVGSGGKRSPLPPQQEHILFEDSMYLSVHVMQTSSGSQASEAYLWCGDEVPEAAIEDAQLFCRKAARESGARLEVIRQGKEKSEFFQALGGIVIIRRNKSSALYMLRGKRHLGHVAFDEVDFVPSSLSSGVPFLLSAKFGKLFLWKGNDSDPEDVGCARLIGMDLGLTGEIEEITEGHEPSSFWESFPYTTEKRTVTTRQSETDKHRGHRIGLYRVELDRPKSSGGFWGLRAASPPKQSNKALVEEICPFIQQDLDPNCIHILDIYSDIYV